MKKKKGLRFSFLGVSVIVRFRPLKTISTILKTRSKVFLNTRIVVVKWPLVVTVTKGGIKRGRKKGSKKS